MNFDAVKTRTTNALRGITKLFNGMINFLMRHRAWNISVLFRGRRGGREWRLTVKAVGVRRSAGMI